MTETRRPVDPAEGRPSGALGESDIPAVYLDTNAVSDLFRYSTDAERALRGRSANEC
jgi:hypothetical protein